MHTLLVVARSNAVLKDNKIYFQRQDALLLNGLCAGFDRLICLIPVVDSNSPIYGVFAIYDGEITDARFQIVPLIAYPTSRPSLGYKLAAWIRSAKTIWDGALKSDRLLVFMPSPTGMLGFLIGMLLRRQMVVYYGGDWAANHSSTNQDSSSGYRLYQAAAIRIRGVLQSLLFRFAPILLVRNAETYKALARRRKNLAVAAPTTLLSLETVYARADTCQNSPIRCLTVSALLPNKGIPDILQALARLRDNRIQVEWCHAGASYPEYKAEIQSLVRKLGLTEVVRLNGYGSTQQLLELYRQADIFVLASYSEGFPRVLIEAMSQSLPVVATRVGGIPFVLENEKHALLVEPHSAQALSQAISRLISDATLRRRLIQNGQAWAAHELAHASPAQQIINLLQA